MQERDSNQRITPEDIEVLAKVSGLPISAERAPALAEQMELAMLAARDVAEAARTSPAIGTEPFDPSWSETSRSSRNDRG